MIHIYDTAPVAGKKAFHTVKNLLKFLESHVRAYDTGICCMYLNGIAVSIYIENAAYRNLYRSSVRNQFDVSGILGLSELDRGKDTAQFSGSKGFSR